MLKTKDLRIENEQELNMKLESLQREIFELNSERLDSRTQKTHLIGEKKKTIARIKTILREKELKDGHGHEAAR